ncbi:MAG: phosphonate ABC transporter, permease protein PhnE [Phormidesmis priestleyi Ana]|uniref:Phosphonate ABC transporter, permease protein PhnE n=1 Tax=Phormidesmis priestleyi Ana TaxID=1666911 RepID=A0A0P8D7U9_9CYAN|nr:MAG: phosphonate ABC transporter, permease protein PhnE [Phormidesmis priestleyi Ana]
MSLKRSKNGRSITSPWIAEGKKYELPISDAVLDMQGRDRTTAKQIGWQIAFIAGLLGLLYYSAVVSEIDLFELLEGGSTMGEYISRYFPPDFTDSASYLDDIIETIGMGIWGTLLAVIFAAPLAIFASANLCPVWIVQPTRRLLDAMRAINEIVFALVFVVAVGLGPFAGVMAIFVHTTGILGKLFSEAIENIEVGPIEGVRATGASKFQEILFGVIPQVIPLWISYTLYRFESNVRSATVLGIVGAGGIGVSLYQSFRSFDYTKVCAILIILIISVGLIDAGSAWLRKRFI